jgi:hypothetical protein
MSYCFILFIGISTLSFTHGGVARFQCKNVPSAVAEYAALPKE